MEWLTSAPLSRRQVEILAGRLTVGETYFYRERAAFAALEEHVLPQLAASRHAGQRRLRIWSAACCTGEEAYSLAIAATRCLPEPARWDISVLATDINPHFLQRAAEGVYGEWSFRGTPPAVRERYCRPLSDGRFQVLPEIRKRVTFDYLNLADNSFPSLLNQTNGMDLIFCRNVLIYFEPALGARVGRRLGRSLSDGGWLFVGAAETFSLLFGELDAATWRGAVVYRKASTPAPRRRPAFVPPAAGPVAEEAPAETRGRRGLPPAPVARQNAAPAPPAPLAKATALFDQGRYAEVVQTLTGLAARGQAEAALLARAHANLGQLSEALACCERAIGADKLNPALHYLRGTILAERGEPEEAAREFRRATYLAPDFVMAHLGLGHLARGRGNAAGAAPTSAVRRASCGASRLTSRCPSRKVSPRLVWPIWLPCWRRNERPEAADSPGSARALAHEEASKPAPEGRIEVVEFVLSGERYAIENALVREVYPLKDLTPLPCTPAFILGIINLRGQILAVMDLRRFFDLPITGITDLNKVIVLKAGEAQAGILADAVVGMRSVPIDDLQPPLPTMTGIRAEYLRGVTSDRMAVLDAARILSDEKIVVQDEVEA